MQYTKHSSTTDGGMAQLNYDNANNPELSSLEQRAARQIATYWRVRVNTTLEKLEREARRMFQLEEDLSNFAKHYYEAVGEVAEKLAQVENKLATEVPSAEVVSIPAVIAQRDVGEARRHELKSRYRSLAKEIHPDRAMVTNASGAQAHAMQTLNAAYQHNDLASLLRLEAQMLLSPLAESDSAQTFDLEVALRDVERAAETYANGYRQLLNSPLNELMLRAMQARLAGWDWMQAVVKKVERTIEEKEREAVLASIAEIGAWREAATQQAEAVA